MSQKLRSAIQKIFSAVTLSITLSLSLIGCDTKGDGFLEPGVLGPVPISNQPAVGPGFLLEDWQWVRPLPSGNSFHGVAHANEDYVAVGYGGTIYSSSDGLVAAAAAPDLYSAAYGNGTYIAVGAQGTILTSSTGTKWTLHNAIDSTAYHYSGVAFGKNTFVIAGGGTVYTSTDNGVAWTKHPDTMPLTTVYFENNQFIGTTDGEKIFTSPDGIIWTERILPSWSFNFTGLCFGQNKYVASNPSGIIYTSPDAVTWTFSSGIGDDIYGVAYGKGLFVAVGGRQYEWGSIYTSTDAVAWTKQEETFLGYFSRVIFTGAKFVAIGEGGLIAESDDGLTNLSKIVFT